MSDDQARKRLGRGLAALIGDVDLDIPAAAPAASPVSQAEQFVPIEFVSRNPRNPRRHFAEGELDDLAQSIREHGIVQPIIVRPAPDHPNHYELIAGERRWRAAQRANLIEIPVIVRDVDDRTALELAIIENVQRSDLNPVEEGLGYQQLIDEHDYTQADLAQVIGKSRSHVANTLRLLKLPPRVLEYLASGELSAGHARCLITVKDPLALAEKIIRDGLSVRQAEVLANHETTAPATRRTPAEKDADTKALEKLLADVIGMKVAISHGKKGGDIKIHYSSLEQLDDICRRLQG